MPFDKVSLDREATEIIDGEATYQLLEWSPHHRACGLCQWSMTVWSLITVMNFFPVMSIDLMTKVSGCFEGMTSWRW